MELNLKKNQKIYTKNNMHILLTRPFDDCKNMIVKFKSLGHIVSHIPLLEIDKVKYKELDFSKYDGIIFTSSNGIKFLDCKKINKNIYCFCVGEVTENEVKKKGFQNIISANGNVNNLLEVILQNFKSTQGKLLYVSGETISFELDEYLRKKNYNIDRLINYKTKHIEIFDNSLIDELKKQIPDIVYIYSENSARSFLNLINNYDLKNIWMNTCLMCIGEKSSSVLNEIKWKKIFLFNSGEEEFLLYKI